MPSNRTASYHIPLDVGYLRIVMTEEANAFKIAAFYNNAPLSLGDIRYIIKTKSPLIRSVVSFVIRMNGCKSNGTPDLGFPDQPGETEKAIRSLLQMAIAGERDRPRVIESLQLSATTLDWNSYREKNNAAVDAVLKSLMTGPAAMVCLQKIASKASQAADAVDSKISIMSAVYLRDLKGEMAEFAKVLSGSFEYLSFPHIDAAWGGDRGGIHRKCKAINRHALAICSAMRLGSGSLAFENLKKMLESAVAQKQLDTEVIPKVIKYWKRRGDAIRHMIGRQKDITQVGELGAEVGDDVILMLTAKSETAQGEVLDPKVIEFVPKKSNDLQILEQVEANAKAIAAVRQMLGDVKALQLHDALNGRLENPGRLDEIIFMLNFIASSNPDCGFDRTLVERTLRAIHQGTGDDGMYRSPAR